MSQLSADQYISKQLNPTFQKHIDQKYKCISDTTVLQTQSGKTIAYFAKSITKQLILILINIDVPQKDSIMIVDVKSKTEIPSDRIYIQIKKSPFMQDVYSLLITNLDKSKGKNQSIFFANLQISKIQQNKYVEVVYSSVQKKQQIKDVIWHPYSPYTLIILAETKIIVLNVQKSIYEPQAVYILQDLKIKNSNERISKGQIQKIGFCQNFNSNNMLESLGKKLSLYLINNKGHIYLVFPFICKRTVLSKKQQIETTNIIKNHKTSRQITIKKYLQNSILSLIEPEQAQNHQQNIQYFLQFKNPVFPQIQVFRLRHLNAKNQENIESKVVIQNFNIYTLSGSTIFVYSTSTRQRKLSLFIQTFTQNPYKKLVSQVKYDKSQNFRIQRVAELKIGKSQTHQSLKLFTDINENNIYLYVNNKTCFKICLDGFTKLFNLTNPQDKHEINYLDVDILFNSKTAVVFLAYCQKMMYLLRYFQSKNDNYKFISVTLQSMELKEKIRKTNEQTKQLFKKLSKDAENISKRSQKKSQQLVQMKQLSQSTLTQIEQKLQHFSVQVKKNFEKKIESIKTYYENIRQKLTVLENHDNVKVQTIKLLNKAQENDKLIKQLMKQSNKQKTRAQLQIQRKLEGKLKLLRELKQKIDRKNRDMTENERQIMNDCEQQADGIIEIYSRLKKDLLNKRSELMKYA